MCSLKSTLTLASLLAALVASDRPGEAAGYPAGPVKIVVPYPAGGPADFTARVLAEKLSEKLGGSFIVENLPGAGGAVGTATVARAPADGQTIVLVVQDFVIAPIVKTNVPFDPFKSFTPVIEVAAAPEMFSVNPSVPATNMNELLKLLKANPGKYNYATPGYATSPHLYSEWLFKLTYGLEVQNVPFQGAQPAVQSTVAGQTQILPITVTAVAPFIKDGCAALRSPATRARRWCPTCRHWMSKALRATRLPSGSAPWCRSARRRRSSSSCTTASPRSWRSRTSRSASPRSASHRPPERRRSSPRSSSRNPTCGRRSSMTPTSK